MPVVYKDNGEIDADLPRWLEYLTIGIYGIGCVAMIAIAVAVIVMAVVA